MDLQQIYDKLLADPRNKMYCINNIKVGLRAALKHKDIRANKPLYMKIKPLLKQIDKLDTPASYSLADQLHIQEAIIIGSKAKSIIEEALGN